MFSQQIAAVIGGATLQQLDGIAATVWKAWGAGQLEDSVAEGLSASVEMRRLWLRGTAPVPETKPDQRTPLPRHLFPARRPQRSPDRQRSIMRRRSIAAAGIMPPALAANFTVGELAALAIIASEAGPDDVCDCSIAEIAARAGVGRTTVQNAVRQAGKLGLLLMTERRRPGRPSLTNLIRIIAPDWKTWIKHGGKRPGSELKTAELKFKSTGFRKLERSGKPTVIYKRTTAKKDRRKPYGPPTAAANAASRS